MGLGSISITPCFLVHNKLSGLLLFVFAGCTKSHRQQISHVLNTSQRRSGCDIIIQDVLSPWRILLTDAPYDADVWASICSLFPPWRDLTAWREPLCWLIKTSGIRVDIRLLCLVCFVRNEWLQIFFSKLLNAFSWFRVDIFMIPLPEAFVKG